MAKNLTPCECGEILGQECMHAGNAKAMAVVEWMPEFLRASHVAAGNSGYWPHNGSVRLRVMPQCLPYLDQDEWTRVVSSK